MNKHGFTGIRKRCSPQHWRKPYYARVSLGADRFKYSRNVSTAEEAAAEYQRMKMERQKVKERPILVLCECCQSEGRILTSDGGPYDTDNGECPVCKGRGDILIECEPITMEDLDAA
jgi:hypothetical protein